MRRLVTGLLVVAGVAAVLVISVGASRSGGSGYRVEALFDNAGYAAPGEQVRIAGATVGTIMSESVTKQNLAAVTMMINAPSFTPWHTNGTCTIRPESLIAERYVDCSPGTSATPALAEIRSGSGAGRHLMGVSQTSSPVDPDIVQGLSTEPVRAALATILDELGTGLAARGSDLNAVILRADPGLAATNRVFGLLASQDHTLAQLATDANTVLAPLARARGSLTGFVRTANATATAAATRSPQVAASIKALPPFLTALDPLMSDLGNLASQGTPDLSDLGSSAAALDREFTGLVPFAARARTALGALSRAASQSEAHLVATEPLARRLNRVGTAAEPSSAALATLSTSLSSTGAISQLMALLYDGVGATNGFDADGHYVRTDLQVGSCTAYARSPVAGCSAKFDGNPGGLNFGATSAHATTASTTPASTTPASTTPASTTSARTTSARTTSARTVTATPAAIVRTERLSGLLDYLTAGSQSSR